MPANAPQLGSQWVDPEDPENDTLTVDFVGGYPARVHYHWLRPTALGDTVFGSRRLRDWPFVRLAEVPEQLAS